MISFRNVTKKYGTRLDVAKKYAMREIFFPSRRSRSELRPQEVLGLRGLSFEVQEGESVLFLGLRDSGKTTAARLICRLTYPTTGHVEVRGRTRLVTAQRIGATPVMKLAEYARLLAMILGADSSQLRGTVDRLLADCNLEDWRHVRVHNAPDGAVKRLGYYAALLIDADTYVFDGLVRMSMGDGGFQDLAEQRLQELFRTRTVVVFASKAPRDVDFDRGLVLHRGDAVYDGSFELARALHNHTVARGDEAGVSSVEEEVRRADVFLQSVSEQPAQDVGRLAWDFEVSLGADKEIRAIAASGKPVVIGPYLSHVDTELLLWVPFVRWAVRLLGIDRARIVCISRGGADAWYQGIGGDYFDAMDLMSPVAFARRHRVLLDRNGSRQMGKEELDDRLVRRALARIGVSKIDDIGWIHPSLFFRVFMAAWRGAVDVSFLRERLLVERLADKPAPPAGLDEPYIGVWLGTTPYLAKDEPLRDLMAGVLQDLAVDTTLVDVSSGRRMEPPFTAALDSATASAEAEGRVDERDVLHERTRIIAHAHGFLGAHGGLSQLAPMFGVPAVTIYHEPSYFRPIPTGFTAVNFRLSWQLIEQMTGSVPTAVDAAKIAPEELSGLVRQRLQAAS